MSCLVAHSQNLFTLEKTLEGQFNLQSTQYDENDVFVDQIPYINLSVSPCIYIILHVMGILLHIHS